MKRESGWRTTANNSVSTAYGVWQGLISNRQKYASRCGANPAQELEDSGTTDVYKQICMMRSYIKESRHKTAYNALQSQIAYKTY